MYIYHLQRLDTHQSMVVRAANPAAARIMASEHEDVVCWTSPHMTRLTRVGVALGVRGRRPIVLASEGVSAGVIP